MEEALYDMKSMRRFVGIDLGNEPVPDETIICKFRHLLEAHGLGESIFQEPNVHLEEKGLRLSEGTIMDATIINAPSSIKNSGAHLGRVLGASSRKGRADRVAKGEVGREKKRDPDMHSTMKGNQYYFGMKIHVRVDRESKTVHSLVTTPADVHDSRMVERLLHGKENAVFGDSAYMRKTEEIKGKAPDALDLTRTRGTKNRKLTAEDKEANRLLSKTRSRVEHIFLIAKKVFGFSKVRYKGLPKNMNFIFVLFALSNLYMVRRDLLEPTGA